MKPQNYSLGENQQTPKDAASHWDEEDNVYDLGLSKWGQLPPIATENQKGPKVRIFKAYSEDWEDRLYRNKSVKAKEEVFSKFLAKYGGLKFVDVDKPSLPIITLDTDDLHYNTSTPAGWTIMGTSTGADGVEDKQAWSMNCSTLFEAVLIGKQLGKLDPHLNVISNGTEDPPDDYVWDPERLCDN